MAPDNDLLRRYADHRDEAAFAELVRRHVNLVHATALRVLNGDTHRAQDVTQSVFMSLARDLAALRDHATVAGWLHTTARFVASNTVRTEQRRQAREQEAVTMNETHPAADLAWEQFRPLLDEAVGQLGEADRDAVLLRYFEGKSHREVGAVLHLDENTARMRVERALDKLRGYFSKRGVTTTAALLAATLGVHAAPPAPAALAATVATQALAGAAGVATATMAGTGLRELLSWKARLTPLSLTVITVLISGVGLAAFFNMAAVSQDRPASNPVATTASGLEAVRTALEQAATKLGGATRNTHGGFVEKGLADITENLDQVKAALAYAQTHPTSAGSPPVVSPSMEAAGRLVNSHHDPLDRAQPNMYDTLPKLKDALVALRDTPGDDWGGRRDKIAAGIGAAATDVLSGIKFLDPRASISPDPHADAFADLDPNFSPVGNLTPYVMPLAGFPALPSPPTSPLRFALGPAGVNKFFNAWADGLTQGRPNLDPKTLRLSLPLGVYQFDASAGKLLASAGTDLFFYIITGSSGDPFVNLLLSVPAGRAPAILTGPFSMNEEQEVPQALCELMAMDRVKTGVYEPRILALFTPNGPAKAIWFKSLTGGGDFLYRIGSSYLMKTRTLYTTEEFLAMMGQAQEILQQRARQGGPPTRGS
jgi:RNA polymerase sigma factor (sigma-70 family)